ncbi:hypothetical protein BC939DRAFT_25959 [Gamsiella multidivaricata]|uniref:uncharacterized protein n=1 Tax=Gamsiella multidivaricata TaxID=101098 RepID=UPI00221F7C01|nr:uncharacterized protein BC939DRAFT_25959 [Gamsiella multidivaricata]KAI7829420.1 hypothetical protein BC939DRAFT_25959 [Gamsiella multidivaricata]
MSKSQPSRSRKIGAMFAYTTLAISLASIGVYVYRQHQKKPRRSGDRDNTSSNTGQDRNPRASLDRGSGSSNGGSNTNVQDEGRSTEVKAITTAAHGAASLIDRPSAPCFFLFLRCDLALREPFFSFIFLVLNMWLTTIVCAVASDLAGSVIVIIKTWIEDCQDRQEKS